MVVLHAHSAHLNNSLCAAKLHADDLNATCISQNNFHIRPKISIIHFASIHSDSVLRYWYWAWHRPRLGTSRGMSLIDEWNRIILARAVNFISESGRRRRGEPPISWNIEWRWRMEFCMCLTGYVRFQLLWSVDSIGKMFQRIFFVYLTTQCRKNIRFSTENTRGDRLPIKLLYYFIFRILSSVI